MSNAHASKLAERLSNAMIGVVWRHWRTLGITVSGSHGADAQTAVDPEALLLASTTFIAEEPRLRDVVASWLTTWPRSLSVQRIRNLAEAWPETATVRLGEMATIAYERGRDHRWKPLLPASGGQIAFGDRAKDLTATRTYRPAGALMIQLRRGMGVGVKADVLAYLLCVSRFGQDWASIAAIREALGYTKAAIGQVVEEMAGARFIRAASSVDRHTRAPRMYRAEAGGWTTVLDLSSGLPEWSRWDQHFLFTEKYLAWARESATRGVSDYAFATVLRDLLERHPRALSTERPTADPLPASTDAYPAYFEARLGEWENWVTNSA